MRSYCRVWRVFLAAVCVVAAAPALASARPATGAEADLGSALAELVATEEAGDSVRERGDEAQLVVTPRERVLVDVIVAGDLDAAAGRLRAAGMEVRASNPGPPSGVVAGYVAVTELERLARVAGVLGVRPVQGAGSDVGAKTSEGDASHRGPEARALGVSGAGIKVGVVSDSMDQVGAKLAGSQASGDLPPGVQVLTDDTTGPIDEGRAMAEIIYDTAPGITQMAFASGTAAGAAGKASGIDALVAAGAKIIADDIFHLSEPFFQDGQVAQAVDRARDAGVLYFASAGNRARQSYESAPRFPAGDNVLHDFDPGAGTDTVQTVATVPDVAFLQVALQWDEPWGKAERDIDAELVRADGTALPGATSGGLDDNLSGARQPSEIVTWTNTSGAAVAVALRISRAQGGGSASPLTILKYIARGNFGPFSVSEHATNSDAINPDAASARGSLAVAAIKHDEPGLNDPEAFSSRGLKTRLFDVNGKRLPAPLVLQKPDLAAADGVSTTVPGFSTFLGTSAAAPSAAGVATLARSAKPTLPLPVLRALVTNPANTIDCSLPGLPDADCGSGFLLADRTVAQAQDASPPVVTQTVNPAAPTGANGWWTGDVSVSYAFSDPGSPVVPSGCDPVAQTSDGNQTTPNCVVQSAGGTTVRPGVALRRDTTPPAAPVITGLPGTVLTSATVPGGVGCTSLDATSGLAGCTVTGLSDSPGAHTLTATATDNAGLASTSTLTYTVSAPFRAASPPTAADVVTLPSNRRCIARTKRLKIKITEPTTGAIKKVSVTVTGVKKAKTLKKPVTITLGRLKRTRTTVKVTVTFKDGRKSSVSRTYKRC